MATQPRPLLSRAEWGGVVLLALLAVAAARAYFAHSWSSWLEWSAYALVVSLLLLMLPELLLVPKRWRAFHEDQQDGGPAESISRALGPGASIRPGLAFVALLLAMFGGRYLHGAALHAFGTALLVGFLGLMGYLFATLRVPRVGRASGIFVAVVSLLFAVSLGLIFYSP